jgi:putative photosynthetic complex assembly protein
MCKIDNDRTLPRAALLAVAALIGVALAATFSVRVLDFNGVQTPITSAVSASRDLRFVDVGRGEVAVYDWSNGKLVATLDPGNDNFIRGVMRGMARERRGVGVGADIPFRITRFDNGSLTLEDPATGRLLVLEAFGFTNARAFNRLLETRSQSTRNDHELAGAGVKS